MSEESQQVRIDRRQQVPSPHRQDAFEQAPGVVEADAAHDAYLNNVGRNPSAAASALRRIDEPTRSRFVVRLQQTYGNAYVQRVIGRVHEMGVARQTEPSNSEVQPWPPTQSAFAEREREVEAIVVEGKLYVLYQKEVRSAGSSSWLANNPGNLDYTEDTVQWGAYEGKKLPWGGHRFAIFPDEDTGLRAVRSYLRKNQTIRNIPQMMVLFAPAGDAGNDPDVYAKRVATALHVPVTTLVKDLDDAQIVVFADTIKTQEQWRIGATHSRDDPSLPEAVRNR